MNKKGVSLIILVVTILILSVLVGVITVNTTLMTEEAVEAKFKDEVKTLQDKIKEYYVIPGGGLEDGETLESNVIRELSEEMNVDIKVLGYLGKFDDEETSQHFFHCEIVAGEPCLGGEELDRMTEDNYYEPTFLPLEELKNNTINGAEFVENALNGKYSDLV